MQPEVLLRRGLAAGGEFRDRAARRRFRHLAAGVRVDFGVQHQHLHVAAAGQDVVEAAVADVVGPAIAADDPDALAHERVSDGEPTFVASSVSSAVKPLLQLPHTLALVEDVRLVLSARRCRMSFTSCSPISGASLASSSPANSRCLSSETRKPRPNSALSSNSELLQAGPRPSAFCVQGVVGRLPP